MERQISLWDYIKSIYEKNFGVTGEMVDAVSVRDILVKSLSGYSNYRISRYYNNDIDYVILTLIEFLGFSGWDDDLDFNPIALYNRSNGNLLAYENEVRSISCITSLPFIRKTFFLCKKFYKDIDSKVKEYERRVV